MAGHLLQLKLPGGLSSSFESLGAARLTRSKQCGKRAKTMLGLSATARLGGGGLRPSLMPIDGNLQGRINFCNIGFSGRMIVAGGGEGECREVKVVANAVVNEDDLHDNPEENSSFPSEFRELIVDRGDPPNYWLFAAGFLVVLLMRDVMVREIALWGINFTRLILYIAEGITIAFSKLSEVATEPVALVMAIAQWAVEAVSEMYALIVESPVESLASSLFVTLAVLCIGDASASRIKGSRSRLVGIATSIGLVGVLEFIPPEAVLLSLIVLTAFAKFVQKADIVTVFMPATVAFAAISSPVVKVAALGLFLAVSIYANWRAAQEPTDAEPSGQPPSDLGESEARTGLRPLLLFKGISACVLISLSAKVLYLRTMT